MPKTIKYTGSQQRWPELSVTGRQSVWFPGQTEQRSDVEAVQLLATGLFFDQDSVNQTPEESAALQALVSGAWNAPSVQRPYRWAMYGDSRANCFTVNTVLAPTGSSTAFYDQRPGMWLVGALGDSQIACNFGVSGDLATGWASSSRANSKTINNLTAAAFFKGGPVDAVYVQYGINDYIAGASAATVSAAIQALCVALMGAGIRVVLESTQPASAASYGASAAAKLQATIDGNAILKAWAAGYPRQLAFADTFAGLVDATGYASAVYLPDGLHTGRSGAMLSGAGCAVAARTLLPAKRSLIYTSGSLLQPNLIDWSGPTQYTNADVGTVTFTTPTWNIDAATGMPYAETTMTCTALAGGFARGRWEVHATTISGGSPRYPIAAGDELQGSAYVTADDGAGGVPPIQCIAIRHRLFSDSKYADVGVTVAAAGSNLGQPVAFLAMCPTFVTATASAGISAPGNAAGYPLQALVEFNAVGQSARVRMYAPSLRVVSSPQPTQPTIAASPATYTNTTGAPLMLYVAGGTVSAITLARQGTALTTGFTSGAFQLAQGDSVTITYTVAPTLTVQPAEQR
jgi:lysophospholipase L1-like esterase